MATESFFNKLHFSSQESSEIILKAFYNPVSVEVEVPDKDIWEESVRGAKMLMEKYKHGSGSDDSGLVNLKPTKSVDSLILYLRFYTMLNNGSPCDVPSEGISKDSAKAIRLAVLRAIADKQLANFIEGTGTWEGYNQAVLRQYEGEVTCI